MVLRARGPSNWCNRAPQFQIWTTGEAGGCTIVGSDGRGAQETCTAITINCITNMRIVASGCHTISPTHHSMEHDSNEVPYETDDGGRLVPHEKEEGAQDSKTLLDPFWVEKRGADDGIISD